MSEFTSRSASNPNVEGMQYHIRMQAGDIPPYVLVPGDPARVQKIAKLWDTAEEVANYRQYVTMKGHTEGIEMACTSSGIGSPALAIALEELVRIGAHTFIRVGTCGSIQPDIRVGDVIISSAAVRLDGASKDYVRVEYPAVADYRVVGALAEGAERLGVRYHVGITASTDTFYTGQGRPGYKDYMPSFQENLFADMQRAQVKNFEMESSCLFTLSSLFQVRAGCVCVVVADRVRDEFKVNDEAEMLPAKVAIEAMKILQKGS
ncbi:MAG: uridine phosphorylase [Anaerolineae bacterium]|nr:uridine phosphorylase [Anaerolineae bacterium]